MINTLIKAVYLCLLSGLLCGNLSAQSSPEIRQIEDERLIELLNNVRLLQRAKTEQYSIALYTLHNGYGSAGFANGEVSQNLLVAVSEFDEVSDQNLFEIGPFYNPVFKEWKESTDKGIFVIEYGAAKKRQILTLSVDIKALTIITYEK